MAAQTVSDPSLDPTSPYYLHPSDSQYKLDSEKFNGSGYNDSKRSVMIGLSAKNKLGFIDGSLEKPDPSDNTLHKAWYRCNSALISWFIQVLDVTIARSVLYFDTAREIWINLEEQFGQTSGTHSYTILQQLADIHQESENISTFFTKMKMLWDEYDAQNTLPVCTCANCTCHITKKILKAQEDKRLIQFLMKLREEFSQVYISSHSGEGVAFAASHKRRFYESNNQQRNRSTGMINADLQRGGTQQVSQPWNNSSRRPSPYFCDHCKILVHGELDVNDDSQQSDEVSSTATITMEQYNHLISLLDKRNDDEKTKIATMVAGTFCLLSFRNSHWIIDSELRTLGYQQSQYDSSLFLKKSGDSLVLAAVYVDDIIITRSSLISWKSKKQGTVSKSSSEVEYRALASTASEVTWLVNLLEELGLDKLKPVTLHCDNQSSIYIAKNPVFHERTKHIEIDCHFTRDKVLEGLIQLSYLPTGHQLADMFTKILPSA
uniref:Retrotransposon Copia-like N-terminal domain-containing protein n=1 Tax=Chenopodium quinoa TaxID=63459 RepID=A0A803MXD9_CHEQI